ncbi:hypothetical protein [Lichenifustis flavocetrariae]|uniref:Uncharacterized protein n=1 Tax=Lichenifustis flavocetrariae TaxID=2949735 RepID=A0AA41YZQ2_9HYPH|nr:hypothetical protein [Lichenifustis flavocetrariae]MCW6511534.1 hypothetical protein [Lichenifustis flavocetrariae]
MLERRGFLRALAALPLVGGGVKLIGEPTAAAVPVTEGLMLKYATFLAHEHREAMFQYMRMTAASDRDRDRTTRRLVPMEWYPEDDQIHGLLQTVEPAKRAAIILSAAGVPFRSAAA